ncbi:acetylornithine deacetylase [Marinobacter changyiensis]|uniref:acetylornithine deacetylase n=1 Tax=Marinobacter changyiensis TaxID=2604091 RepID=UPI0015D2C05F|nr:acetylornithine deacetylase [Marinobacter changyiensis]
MKKLFYTLVVLALVAFVAFKGAVWWLTEQRMAELGDEITESGVVHWQRLSSNLSGEVTLHGVRYQQFRLTQPLNISLLNFSAGSPVALMRALLDPAQLPQEWQLDAEGVRLQLDAAMIKSWVAPEEDTNPALFGLTCGPDHRQQLGSGDLVRMGVSDISGEILLRQSRDHLHFELSTAGTGSVEMTARNYRLPLVFGQAGVDDVQPPRPEHIDVVLRDGGLMRKVAVYCARESQMDVPEWVALITRGFRDALNARGYEPSKQLVALYQRWLSEGGQLEFTLAAASPTLGVPVHTLEEAGSNDASFDMTYNRAGVPDVYLTRMEPERAELPEQAFEPVVPDESESAMADWRPAPVAEASRWLERTVRVTLASGRIVEGRLTGVSEDRLEVSRMVDGGEVAYPMVIRAVERFDVWRRASDQGRPFVAPEPEPEPEPEVAPENELETEAGPEFTTEVQSPTS